LHDFIADRVRQERVYVTLLHEAQHLFPGGQVNIVHHDHPLFAVLIFKQVLTDIHPRILCQSVLVADETSLPVLISANNIKNFTVS